MVCRDDVRELAILSVVGVVLGLGQVWLRPAVNLAAPVVACTAEEPASASDFTVERSEYELMSPVEVAP